VSPAAVMLAAVEAGAVLWLEGTALRFGATTSVLDGELGRRLVAARGAVVVMLRAGACLPPAIGVWPPDVREAFEERAANLEFDGGLAREVAEREAERLVRVEHARAFVARNALVVQPAAAAVAGERPGDGPHR
jgi:hypothetical protein